MKFEIIDAKSNRHRLTISPSEQRVTVKIATEASPEERDRFVAFCRAIYNWTGFSWSSTVRGGMEIGDDSIQLLNDGRTESLVFGFNGVGVFVKRESNE